MTEYTNEMVAELRALSPIDNDKALAFAAEYDLPVHSVRAKAVRDNEIEYVRKPKMRKDGTPPATKAEIVAEIANALGQDAERLESLGNATRDVLVIIRNAVA